MKYVGNDKYEIYIGKQKIVAEKSEIIELINNFKTINTISKKETKTLI